MITNLVCKLLNIEHPIIQGGMGNISNAKLTSAVSEAGGLGTIGAGTMTPKEVEEIIISTKSLTNKPIAVNIAINVTSYVDELIDVIIKHKIAIVTLSAGNPAPYIPILKEKGIKVLTIVAAVTHAVKAESAGSDAIIVEGFEAAGINSNLELTTFTLIPQIVNAVNIPVIAAGGIGDGKGFAAALILGANGVQMGTRFIATTEAPFHEYYKAALVNAKDTSTHIIGRSIGQSRRVIKNTYSEHIIKKEEGNLSKDAFTEMTTEEKHKYGAIEGNFEDGFINGGQISGLIQDIPSVKSLINRIIIDAKEQVQKIDKQLS